jgi:hypothetical protein
MRLPALKKWVPLVIGFCLAWLYHMLPQAGQLMLLGIVFVVVLGLLIREVIRRER